MKASDIFRTRKKYRVNKMTFANPPHSGTRMFILHKKTDKVTFRTLNIIYNLSGVSVYGYPRDDPPPSLWQVCSM